MHRVDARFAAQTWQDVSMSGQARGTKNANAFGWEDDPRFVTYDSPKTISIVSQIDRTPGLIDRRNVFVVREHVPVFLQRHLNGAACLPRGL
jgi:hypothetical protein